MLRVFSHITIRNCIIDKNSIVPPTETVGIDPIVDQRRLGPPSDGIVVVPRGYEFNLATADFETNELETVGRDAH